MVAELLLKVWGPNNIFEMGATRTKIHLLIDIDKYLCKYDRLPRTRMDVLRVTRPL